MKWFFCLDDGPRQFDLARVAVATCLAKTDFRPHCIYSGQSDAALNWFSEYGVAVHRHPEPTVAGVIRRHYPDPQIALGAYLRTDVPLFLESADDWVVYTDVDVMFVGNCLGLKDLRPATISISRDLDPLDADQCNSGVLLINAQAMKADHAAFMAWIEANARNWHDWDQEAYMRFYVRSGRSDVLPLEYNWRAFWHDDWAVHHSGNSLPRTIPLEIVHFQMPKPWDADNRFGATKLHPLLQTPQLFERSQQWLRWHHWLASPLAYAGGSPPLG